MKLSLLILRFEDKLNQKLCAFFDFWGSALVFLLIVIPGSWLSSAVVKSSRTNEPACCSSSYCFAWVRPSRAAIKIRRARTAVSQGKSRHAAICSTIDNPVRVWELLILGRTIGHKPNKRCLTLGKRSGFNPTSDKMVWTVKTSRPSISG